MEKKYPVEEIDLDEETEENVENPIVDNFGNNRARGTVFEIALFKHTYF